jgi:hypothetical protein
MPEQWSKLLTKSAITREDYARDPQAVLDVLEFYTDHKKREMEELGLTRLSSNTSGTTTATSSYISDSTTGPPARFNAGTGLGGMTKITPLASSVESSSGSSSSSHHSTTRPPVDRQKSAPGGLNGEGTTYPQTTIAAARAAELNGAAPGTIRPLPQASRPAPPRPLLTGSRPTPTTATPPVSKADFPSSADLRARQKAQGPSTSSSTLSPDLATKALPMRKESLTNDASPPTQRDRIQNDRERERERQAAVQREQREQLREEREREKEREREREREREKAREEPPQRPVLQQPPSKSSPATSLPTTQPAPGAAGATAGPPPIRPLQPKAKPNAPTVTIQTPDKGVAAAAAALERPLEKPKEKEKRISTMTEVQIMEKLRSVVSDDDPKLLYSKIKKVGQGCVAFLCFTCFWVAILFYCLLQCFRTRLRRKDPGDWQEGGHQGDGSCPSTTERAHRQRDYGHERISASQHCQLPRFLPRQEQRTLGSHGVYGRRRVDGHHREQYDGRGSNF